MHMKQTAKALKGNKRLNLMDENKEKNKIYTKVVSWSFHWYKLILQQEGYLTFVIR